MSETTLEIPSGTEVPATVDVTTNDGASKIASKVGGATAASAASIIFVWGLTSLGVTVPLEVAGAFATLFAFSGGWLASK